MLQDLRLALRRLARSPAWTLATVTVLALGLGLGVTIFALTDALVYEPPRVAQPERLLSVFADDEVGASGVTDYEPMAYPDVRDLRLGVRGFADVTAYAPSTAMVEVGADGFGTVAELVERNYFRVLGLVPESGRFFTAETGDGCDAVVGSEFRRRHGFRLQSGANELRVNGRPLEVVGVAPRGFRGLTRGLQSDLWLPMDCVDELRFDLARNVRLGRATPGLDRIDDRGLRWVWAVGRLRAGARPDAVRDQVAALGARLAREHPATNRGRRFAAASTASLRLAPDIDRRMREASSGSLVVAFCVLAVACSNVAALLLVRARNRRREFAARRALGAGTLRILRLLWIEAAVLAALGALGALALGSLAALGLDRLNLPVPIPIELGVSLDAATVWFALAAALAASLAFVSAPAIEELGAQLRDDLSVALRAAGTAGERESRLLAVSVVLQVAVSLALWIAAVTAAQGLVQAHRTDPGCRPEGVVTARFDLGLQGFSADRRADVHEQAAEAVAGLPGARSVTYASHLPLALELLLSRVASRPGAEEDQSLPADRALVDVGYFEALGVELLAGRGFNTSERDGGQRVAVVNLELARRLWGVRSAADALGRELWQPGVKRPGVERPGVERPLRVVGVARTGKYRGLAEADRGFFYEPLPREAAGARVLLVRFDGSEAHRRAEIERTLARVEPRLIVHRLETAEEAMAASLFVPRAASTLLAVFSALALLLAAAGLYGVLGHSVLLRRREIGIRMAVGGAPRRVAAQVLSRRAIQIFVGLFAGLAAGLFLSSRLAAFVDVAGGWQPASVLAACLVVLAVTGLAGALPARRAARTEPSRVLRSESD